MGAGNPGGEGARDGGGEAGRARLGGGGDDPPVCRSDCLIKVFEVAWGIIARLERGAMEGWGGGRRGGLAAGAEPTGRTERGGVEGPAG